MRTQLLPGVAPSAATPDVVCQSAAVVRRARLRAAFRDGADLVLLLLVDALFLRWPMAHVPLFGRHDSVALVAALNASVITYIWLSRQMPQWRARRMSSTWCVAERQRLRF